jgi:drug/metabolite transporter (DMT)-like permease
MKEIKFLVPYVVFMAFSYYFAKNGLIYASPFAFMGLRYLLAAGVLLAMSRKLIFSRNLLYLSLMTVTSTMFWSYGLLYVSPAESAVLSYSMPLFSLPIAFFMVSEKPSRTELIGIFVGFTGIMVYGLPLLQGFTEIGMILTVINAFFWGMFTVFYRKLKDQDPVSINASQMLIGGLIMMALSPLDFSLRINYEFLIDLLWMGTMGGALQFLLWNYMIRISKVNRITVLAFSVPIFTMVLGAIMSDAFPGFLTTAGVSIMFFGILISRLKGGISIVDNGAH